MRIIASTLAALALAADPPSGHAQSEGVDRYLSPTFKSCIRAVHATVAMIRCQVAETERQQAAEEATYRARVARADPALRRGLVADEHAWRAATLVDCGAAQHRPGEWSSVRAQGCYIDAYVERRLKLERG